MTYSVYCTIIVAKAAAAAAADVTLRSFACSSISFRLQLVLIFLTAFQFKCPNTIDAKTIERESVED